jgi:mannose-1-phosphate guanylyltransferase
MNSPNIWGVVLAGGSGTRCWPLSTPSHPKQLLPLVSDQSMLADTVARLDPLIPVERILILTAASLADAVRAAIPAIPRENILTEPRPAGTAAALAFAARVIERRDPTGVMCCVHADWSIAHPQRFRAALASAADVAPRHQALLTVGIVASRPDSGFGYILPGEVVEGAVRRVSRFFEKPSRERAAELIGHGGLWNSGIFVWEASRFLAEARRVTPELAAALATAPDDDAGFFAAVSESISVDVGVLERSQDVLVLPGDFGWDDVGTWAALRRVRDLDAQGNAIHGDVTAHESRGNVVHGTNGSIVLYGVNDLVVVQTDGLTVVTTIDRAADLKALLGVVRPELRDRP